MPRKSEFFLVKCSPCQITRSFKTGKPQNVTSQTDPSLTAYCALYYTQVSLTIRQVTNSNQNTERFSVEINWRRHINFEYEISVNKIISKICQNISEIVFGQKQLLKKLEENICLNKFV